MWLQWPVTPHGGFCGGKSQQWLRYPTGPSRACWARIANWSPPCPSATQADS
jgi:hypothetical protein